LVFMGMLSSCKPDMKATVSGSKYFDIKGYFERDSARLTKLNQAVFKSVNHNGNTESKKILIANWGAELSLFKNSDINRPAWKGSYKISGDSNIMIYQALDPELKTREILVKKTYGKVKYILIVNDTRNLLYKTQEKLSYFPDSMYQIQKAQSVRLLGTNKYDIKGLFK
jgi:hypothetical protein